MTVLFREVLVYDAASPTAMTGPVDVLVENDRISAIGPGLAAPPESPGRRGQRAGTCWCPG